MDTPEEEKDYIPFFDENRTEYCNVSVKLEQLEDEDIDPRYFVVIWIYKTIGTKKQIYFDV